MQLKELKRRLTAVQRQRRRLRILFRKAKRTVIQEKDRWPSDWKPLTISEVFDQ